MSKAFFPSALLCCWAITSVAATVPPKPIDGDVSSADIQWDGHAKIIPGNFMTITGANGAMDISDGELNVYGNGTFTTKTPVKLESRFYLNYDSSVDGSREVGDLVAATWRLSKTKPVTVSWGANTTDGMKIDIRDLITNKSLTRFRGPTLKDQVMLAVTNNSPTSATPVDPRAELSVQATIIASVIYRDPI
ncbi:TPA: hypothetical protein ACX6PO_003928 [Photobacterium damselae]